MIVYIIFLLQEIYCYFQITDEHGNPIQISIQEARQLLSQGHFISQLNDGQIIRVHPGIFAQHLQALNIHIDEEAAVAAENSIVTHPNVDKEEMETIQTDAEAIVQALEVISNFQFYVNNCKMFLFHNLPFFRLIKYLIYKFFQCSTN